MSILSQIFAPWTAPKAPPMLPLWEAIVAEARRPDWYLRHQVPDTLDGRFDMVALVTSLAMLRMEALGLRAETALLTECFVADMDGSMRDLGIGDMVVGKHVTRMAGLLGGRVGGYRDALADSAPDAALVDALARNVYRGRDDAGDAGGLADAVRALNVRIAAVPADALLGGRLV